ncbi:LLM class flavin-dependent oxidoreductase [Bradyrhizobium sp. STM 3561]|uniref:LLM class flavin-dependent oxidoreductase n=1 Tax=Bradyrhizobium sp. STM 3561 TaxID=578923 RepID=UPI00388E9C9A
MGGSRSALTSRQSASRQPSPRGATIQHNGQGFVSSGRCLSNSAQNIPLFLAASGPPVLELAGATVEAWSSARRPHPSFIRWTIDLVRKGEQHQERKFKKTASVYVSTDDQEIVGHVSCGGPLASFCEVSTASR